MASFDFDAAAAALGPAMVVVETESRLGSGFFVSPDGLIATAFHLVADAQMVRVRLHDGRQLAVEQVAGVDARRNLALLRVPGAALDFLPLRGAEADVPKGEPVFIQAVPGTPEAIALVRVGQSERVNDWLTVLMLPALSPETAAGAPLLDRNGHAVGIATRVHSNVGPLCVGVPARYLKPLVAAPQSLGLSALAGEHPRPKAIRRTIPSHPLALLDGSPNEGLEAIGAALVAAIQVGAPAYNEGDVERCYRIYEETARRLVEQRDDCPGPQRALRDGLARAAALDDANAQSWAMRDAFDGLLIVLERWTESKRSSITPAATPSRPPPKRVLN
jgi:S1-C subfamily serine protease